MLACDAIILLHLFLSSSVLPGMVVAQHGTALKFRHTLKNNLIKKINCTKNHIVIIKNGLRHFPQNHLFVFPPQATLPTRKAKPSTRSSPPAPPLAPSPSPRYSAHSPLHVSFHKGCFCFLFFTSQPLAFIFQTKGETLSFVSSPSFAACLW